MVSPATGLFPDVFPKLLNRETHGPELGFLGSNCTGVLHLSLALSKARARASGEQIPR
jgi:K+-transporting ATPase c subunit